MAEIVLVRDGKPHAAIAAGGDDAHGKAIHQMQQAILQTTGAKLPIIDDTQAEKELGKQNLVVIGNLMTNRVAARLYRNYYVNSDAIVPGPGRYELRTVHDPEALGIGVVFCGGSDTAGIEASVERFLDHVKPGRDLTFTHLVEMETDGLPPPLADEELKKRIEKIKGPFSPGGFIAEQGMYYYRSGNPNYLRACKEAIPKLLAGLEGQGPIKDFRSHFAPVWDQIEEAPVFTDDERAAACGYLLGCLELTPQLHTLDAGPERKAPPLFQYTMPGGHAASLYLTRFCPGLPLAQTVQERIARYFDLQNDYWKLYFDSSWYTHSYFNWYMTWFLTSGDLRYMERGHLAEFCDYIMAAIITNERTGAVFGDGGGGPGTTANILGLAAWYYQDGRYEWFKRFLGGSWSGDWNLGHTYATNNIEPRMPRDILGVRVVPAEDWVYEKGIGGQVENTPLMPPRQQAYDKISFRTKFDRDSSFLLLDGLSGFGMAHADANNIVQLWDKGQMCLAPAGYMVYELSEHNVVVVTRDGAGGTEKVPTLAGLEVHTDMARFGAVRSMLHNYNGMDWARNILWAKDRYFLVIDELTAVTPGDYVLQGWWQAGGMLDGRRLSSGDDVRFQLVSLDDSELSQTTRRNGGSQLRTSQTGVLEPGDRRVFMNLLQCTRAPHEDAVDAKRLTRKAAVLRHNDEIEVLGSGPLTGDKALAVEAQLYLLHSAGFNLAGATALSCGTLLFESQNDATVDCDLVAGKVRVGLKRAGEVALLAAANGEVRRNGELLKSRVREDGLLSFELPVGQHDLRVPPLDDKHLAVIERTLQAAWARSQAPTDPTPGLKSDAPEIAELWQFKNPSDSPVQTHALTLGDLDGDGIDEILMGSADNVLRCFDGDGRLLWKYETDEWVCSVWVGDLDGDGSTRILVGTGRRLDRRGDQDSKAALLILDAKGQQQTRIPYPAGSIETVTGLDIDGDGVKEIIAGSHDWQLSAVRLDGQQVWSTYDYSRGPTNLQTYDVTGDGKPEIISTTTHRTNFYNLEGNHLFHLWSPGPGLAFGDSDGDHITEIAVGSVRGHVRLASYVAESKKGQEIEPTWTFDTGAPVEVIRMADLDGSGSDEILACSRNNLVYAFGADGRILWTRSLGDGVRALEVAYLDGGDTPQIICGTDAGQVFVLAPDGTVITWGAVPGLVRFVAVDDKNGKATPQIIAATDGPGLYALKWTGR